MTWGLSITSSKLKPPRMNTTMTDDKIQGAEKRAVIDECDLAENNRKKPRVEEAENLNYDIITYTVINPLVSLMHRLNKDEQRQLRERVLYVLGDDEDDDDEEEDDYQQRQDHQVPIQRQQLATKSA